MKLIAEAGGTKIAWVLLDGKKRIDFATVGYNPLQNDSNYLRQVLISGFPRGFESSDVHEIAYFGTGCASEDGKARVVKALNHFFMRAPQIDVYSDLFAVGVAYHKNSEGIVGILGTGASVAYYNGSGIEMPVPSLGYLLGDEGSGAYLGRVLLSKIIRKELDLNIIQDFYQHFEMDADKIIPHIYKSKQPAQLLASYAQFLSKHNGNEAIKVLINDALDLYLEKHLQPMLNLYPDLPIAIVGSVASGLERFLELKIKQIFNGSLLIRKSPLEGLL